jgi:hypothetical protein
MLENEGGTGCALGPAGAGARPAWELTWSPRPCPAGCASLAGEWRQARPAQRFAYLVGGALMLAGVAYLAAWLVVGGRNPRAGHPGSRALAPGRPGARPGQAGRAGAELGQAGRPGPGKERRCGHA